MAHPEQANFIRQVKDQYPEFFKNKKVLDVGSLDINGTARDIFDDCDYTGIDVGEGPCVDIVCPGQEYDAPDGEYDVVLSAECFEHNPYWLETFTNMFRMCKDEGLVFFTCATHGREEHGTTRSMPHASPLTVNLQWDYYRNLDESDFTSKIDFDKYFDEYRFETRTEYPQDLYFVGKKKSNTSTIELKTNFSRYVYWNFRARHWQDLIRMTEDRYGNDIGEKDTIIFALCNFRTIHDIKKEFYGAEKYIVYQLEPLHDKHWHTKEKIINNIRGADEVWDYDLDNIKILEQYGIKAKFKPFLYTDTLKTVKNKEDPDIDVLFYGSITKGRMELLEKLLHQGLMTEKFVMLFNYEGPDLDEYVARSKIILDMHTDSNHRIQKQTRLFYALINNKCVISEKSFRNYYGDLIVEVDRDEYVPTIMDYLNNGKWKTHTENLSERFKSLSIEDILLNVLK